MIFQQLSRSNMNKFRHWWLNCLEAQLFLQNHRSICHLEKQTKERKIRIEELKSHISVILRIWFFDVSTRLLIFGGQSKKYSLCCNNINTNVGTKNDGSQSLWFEVCEFGDWLPNSKNWLENKDISNTSLEQQFSRSETWCFRFKIISRVQSNFLFYFIFFFCFPVLFELMCFSFLFQSQFEVNGVGNWFFILSMLTATSTEILHVWKWKKQTNKHIVFKPYPWKLKSELIQHFKVNKVILLLIFNLHIND